MRRILSTSITVLCGLAIIAEFYEYPGNIIVLAVSLIAYCILIALKPQSWLVTLPPIVICWSQMLDTGWIVKEESDAFVLATCGVLVPRLQWRNYPPFSQHLGISVFFLYVAILGVGVIQTIFTANSSAWLSANPYIHPINAFRSTKGAWMALLLVPLLTHEYDSNKKAIAHLSFGIAIGTFLAACFALIERIQFCEITDFKTDYRIIGCFPSMHLGGSQIAIMFALGVPFILALSQCSRRYLGFLWMSTLPLLLYCVTVSFARAGIACFVIGCVVQGVLLLLMVILARSSLQVYATKVFLFFGFLVFCFVSIGVSVTKSEFLRGRLSSVVEDFDARLSNWRHGVELSAPGLVGTLLGQGAGSFPRVAMIHSRVREQSPTDYEIGTLDEEGLSIRGGATLYFCQRIKVFPRDGCIARIKWRSKDANCHIKSSIGEKLALYSINSVEGIRRERSDDGDWRVDTFHYDSLSQSQKDVLLQRPIVFSFWSTSSTGTINVSQIELRSKGGGRERLLENNEFHSGLDHWFISDDYHWCWRIENEFVASYFDGGLLRLVSLICVLVAGFFGSVRLLGRFGLLATAFPASMCVILFSFLFDTPLQSQRLSIIIYVIFCFGVLGLKTPKWCLLEK